MKGFLPNLSRVAALTRKELFWYLNNPAGFIVIGLFIGFSNFLFLRDFFVSNNATLRPYFLILPWLLVFLTAGISMRIFSEEKRSGTLEVLLSLPLTEWELVLGKFLGSLIFVAVTLLGAVTLPITVVALGNPDPGPIVSGYAGILLLCAAFLSVGIFVSTLTKNQVVSLLSTVLVLFLLATLGDDLILQQVPKSLGTAFSFIGFSHRLLPFTQGVIDLRNVVFFLTVTFGLLFLSVKMTENRG